MGVLSPEQLLFAFCAGLKVRKFPTTAIKTVKNILLSAYFLCRSEKNVFWCFGKNCVCGWMQEAVNSWNSREPPPCYRRFCSWHGVLWAPCVLFILAVYEPHWLTSEWIYISLFRNVQKSIDEDGRGNKYQRTSGLDRMTALNALFVITSFLRWGPYI